MTDPASEPSPPGSPMRQDKPEGHVPGGHADEASQHADEHGSTIPLEEEQPRPAPDDEETPQQHENAETSLDQPSDG